MGTHGKQREPPLERDAQDAGLRMWGSDVGLRGWGSGRGEVRNQKIRGMINVQIERKLPEGGE